MSVPDPIFPCFEAISRRIGHSNLLDWHHGYRPRHGSSRVYRLTAHTSHSFGRRDDPLSTVSPLLHSEQ